MHKSTRGRFLRAATVAAASVAVAPASAIAQPRLGGGFKTIPYEPLDVEPYYDPMTLTRGEIDAGIWPAVRRMNESGWVWTAESCEGHKHGWSTAPEIRLVCRKADLGVLLPLLYDVARPGRSGEPLTAETTVLITRHRDAPRGWAELRVFAWTGPTGVYTDAGVRAGRSYFERLADAAVHLNKGTRR